MSTDVIKWGMTYQIYCPIKLRVEPDPLGDVNCIIRVLRRSDDEPIRSILHTNTPGLEPKIGYGNITDHGDKWWMLSFPVWTVEIDGKRILEIPEHETWGPFPPIPKPPLRRRIQQRGRELADAVAKRLGYMRTAECDHDDY